MSGLLGRVSRAYTKHPLLFNVGLYGTLYGLGDASQQKICGKKNVDLKSSVRVSSVGASVFGPFYFFWYKFLDKRVPGTAARTIMKKVVLDQAIAGSGGIAIFFVATSILEGADNIFEDAITKGPKTFLTGCVYWPLVQTLNFVLIPAPYRAVYVAGAAFVWTNIICYIKSKTLPTPRSIPA